MKLSGKIIGGNEPIFIVAEVANSHEGSLDKMKRIIRGAAYAGADAIKFQKFFADELFVSTSDSYKLFKRLELSDDEWKQAFSYARELELTILGECFDEKSVDFFDELGVSGFKIHSTDLCNPFMLKHVAKKGKPVFLAVGGSRLDEIKSAIDIVEAEGNNEIMLILGYQNFPTKIGDTNLKRIKTLQDKFGLLIGFHDHVDAESVAAISLPVMAIGAGAVLIDKHITYDRSKKGIDYFSSLNPDEFKQMVQLIRECEKASGTSEIELSSDEMKYRKKMKKYIVAGHEIKKGQKIGLSDLKFKRAGFGLLVNDYEKILGKKAKKDFKKDDAIDENGVE